MSPQQFTQLFDSFHRLNILIIGDVMIDSYLMGDVERISPEAPVPVVSVNKREHRLGGAANVALNVKALGANPILCSIIGNDEKGGLMVELLNNLSLSDAGIIQVEDRKTTIKTRIISHNQQILRVDDEVSHPVSLEQAQLLEDRVNVLLKTTKIDAIVFEDYDKGVITPDVIEKVVAIANKSNIPTLVDPKKRNFLAYKNVTFFKPNFKEFKEGLKLEIHKSDKETLLKEVKSFMTSQNIKVVMVTLSEYGVLICEENNHSFIPAEIRNISDVSGAGDTVISVCTLAMASGMDAPLMAKVANMAGGLVCEIPGVVPVDKVKLLEECVKKLF